ncbi:TraR/DksA family transcriptional regulator [Pseudomonas sp. NPDC086278]|uniref:TraR/DksA family transcriptional regulator n=1 Tax=Pseudomonas sp. NPDC086278 TaxID=3390646 RepID=UPI003D033AF5
MLSEKELRAQGDDEYMSPSQVQFFRYRLKVKAQDLRDRLYRNKEQCVVMRQPDETDAAVTEVQRSLALNIIERDSQELTSVVLALQIIDASHYGYCIDTGEPIGIDRLLVVPESLYSVEAMRTKEAKKLHMRR